jgi:uracil-DNA glycosylase family 4
MSLRRGGSRRAARSRTDPGVPAAAAAGETGDRVQALAFLNSQVIACRACPRLVKHREQMAREKRRAFRDQTYWGKPIPGFGDPAAPLLLLGLAPAAHGGNRTGRMFTGDRSGDFLFAALHRAGFASQPTSVSVDDGLTLRGAYLTASVRCAPPANRPLPEEIEGCAPFLRREIVLLPEVRLIVCLGGLAFRAALDLARSSGYAIPRPRPAFGHGAEVRLERAAGIACGPAGPERLALLGCYHPSQQNTFTGRLTPALIDAVLRRAGQILEEGSAPGRERDRAEAGGAASSAAGAPASRLIDAGRIDSRHARAASDTSRPVNRIVHTRGRPAASVRRRDRSRGLRHKTEAER